MRDLLNEPSPERSTATLRTNGKARLSEVPSAQLATVAGRPIVVSESLSSAARERVNRYAGKARSANTHRAYEKDFAAFRSWCDAEELAPLPAASSTVAAYVTNLADEGYAVATITRHLASISVTHKLNGHETPTRSDGVAETMQGVRRELGTAQRKKDPLTVEDLRRVVEPLGASAVDLRDRAILVLGFAAAFRRSEIVSLDIDDLAFIAEGLAITLRRSKTDQEGAGTYVAVPYGSNLATCPVRAVQAWLGAVGATSGPVFRAVDRTGRILARRLGDQAVAVIVQKRAAAVGLEGDLSGHSLRAGFATSAANAGVSLVDSMRQTRHKSMDVARGYVRRRDAWDRNAAKSVGL